MTQAFKKMRRMADRPTLFAEGEGWTFRPEYGYFIGEIRTVWWPDGENLQLVDTVLYKDRHGMLWPAYAGNVVNGSSIPPTAWSLLNRSPMRGRHRAASVFHDVACVERRQPWRTVHQMFLEACLAAGEDEDMARAMGLSVMAGGPRWQSAELQIDAADCDEYLRGYFCLGRGLPSANLCEFFL